MRRSLRGTAARLVPNLDDPQLQRRSDGSGGHRRAAMALLWFCSTPTTTYSQQATWTNGIPNRSRRRSVTGGSTGRGAADDKSGVITHLAVLRVRRVSQSTCESCSKAKRNTAATSRVAHHQAGGLRRSRCRGHLRHGQRGNRPADLHHATARESSRRRRHGHDHGRTPPQRDVRGPAPDALMVLIKLLSTLMDDEGNATIDGISGSDWEGAEYPEEAFRELAQSAAGPAADRFRQCGIQAVLQPAVSVVGLDARQWPQPRTRSSTAKARSASGSRRAWTAKPPDCLRGITQPLPFGVEDRFPKQESSQQVRGAGGWSGYDAFSAAMGTRTAWRPPPTGAGGAVPFVANLIESRPELEVLGVGAQDPLARITLRKASTSRVEDSIVASICSSPVRSTRAAIAVLLATVRSARVFRWAGGESCVQALDNGTDVGQPQASPSLTPVRSPTHVPLNACRSRA